MRSAAITVAAIFGAVALSAWDSAAAEPYLAVEAGLKCSACHVNPTGGGKRTLFGMLYARNNIAVRRLFTDADAQGWNSEVNRRLGIGGDYRGGYSDTSVPDAPDYSGWATRRATAYLELRALPGLLTLYADEQLAPGNAVDREAYLLLTPKNRRYWIKLGQMFLPFGLRLEDDSTFVRQRSGINFATPDDGVELGLELAKWSAQAAFSNGTAGAGHRPGKNQTSLSVAYVLSKWRLGTSVNISKDPLGDRDMLAVFAGLKTGPVSWLAEIDAISDELGTGRSRDIRATLLEGNWRIRKGHNLKVGYEFLDPSSLAGDDEQERYRVVWEYSPTQLYQTRVGFTSYNGVPGLPATNRGEFFFESHVFF